MGHIAISVSHPCKVSNNAGDLMLSCRIQAYIWLINGNSQYEIKSTVSLCNIIDM